MRKKANKDEVQKRINLLIQLRLKGMPVQKMFEYVTSNHFKDNQTIHAAWHISKPQFNRYWKKAQQHFEEVAKTERTKKIGEAIERIEDIIMQAHNIRDYRLALAAQRELNMLLGLNEAIKLHMNGDIKTDNKLTVEIIGSDKPEVKDKEE